MWCWAYNPWLFICQTITYTTEVRPPEHPLAHQHESWSETVPSSLSDRLILWSITYSSGMWQHIAKEKKGCWSSRQLPGSLPWKCPAKDTWGCCPGSFSVVMRKYPVKSNLREKELALAHNSRLQSITAGKSQPQERERTGHITFRMVKSSKPWLNPVFSNEYRCPQEAGLPNSVHLIKIIPNSSNRSTWSVKIPQWDSGPSWSRVCQVDKTLLGQEYLQRPSQVWVLDLAPWRSFSQAWRGLSESRQGQHDAGETWAVSQDVQIKERTVLALFPWGT